MTTIECLASGRMPPIPFLFTISFTVALAPTSREFPRSVFVTLIVGGFIRAKALWISKTALLV